MNWRVFILAATTFAVGLVELIVGGILPYIADDLNVSVATAGQLITIFALVYAISAPVLLSLTAKVERKQLYLISLFLFTLGNVMTYFSPTFAIVMIARIITAMSTALVIVLSLTITTKIVEPRHRAKALGLIFVGVSSALVIGVPMGIFITEAFGWRAVFLGIAMLSSVSMILIFMILEKMPVVEVVPLKAQIKSLANWKIASAHLTTLFMLAGHYMLYAYFTPFLVEAFNLSSSWISICYLVFGLASVSGNAIGGWLSDQIGTGKSIVMIIATFAIVLFSIPYTIVAFPLFLVVTVLWGALSWALTPPLQNYLIQTDPKTSDIQQSLNTAALQIGISIGSAIGGAMFTVTGSVMHLASFGAILVLAALGCAIFSLKRAPLAENLHLNDL
ncbi:MFS transporter [Lysinibacillus sphaericus]|uniref:MFS transporter n=1 Tax=Lysinibacillus sphaericus TaxID=1421 RepID=A0A2S0JZM4_LYSSH|nr:MFS transporter [Lysinibacillus sphaericus]AVK96585.1 MFS transporter [Lysinibacillus sphaericus]MED4542884.1 MFS transporter [Lysinibacillus sphaericus]TKI19828.1 MFS transporter [Lysinibacillus sphaericus]